MRNNFRVVYWNNIPAPYMVERFNAVAGRRRFEFEVWFNDRTEAGRSWEVDEGSWRFKYRYLPTTRIGGHLFHWPLAILGPRPDVLVSLYGEPSFVIGSIIAKWRGTKTALWVEVTFDRWVKRRAYRLWIKRKLFSLVDAIVTVGEDGKAFAINSGAPAHRVYFAPHAIDVSHYRDGAIAARCHGRQLRSSLGIKGVAFLYVGRLWWGKGIDSLLEAFELVQRDMSDEISLLLVGDGPEEDSLRKICIDRGLRNVVFAGFKQKQEMPEYFAIADVFVFPTLGDPYGLVVDEAMASSLPVISTSAAGEICARVDEGVNGYIVPPAEPAAMAERMLILARDQELRERMGKASAQKIDGHTPEKWAEDFEKIVCAMLDHDC